MLVRNITGTWNFYQRIYSAIILAELTIYYIMKNKTSLAIDFEMEDLLDEYENLTNLPEYERS